jgi:GH24 family phage-related lysozyme (muramidase)
MKASAECVRFLKRHEVFVPWVYDDLAAPSTRVTSGHRVAGPYKDGPVRGTLTIGYGHTAAAGPPDPRNYIGREITEAEAFRILQSDIAEVEEQVTRMIRRPLNQGQYDALVAFAFNVGGPALQRSTLLKHINAGRWDRVPGEWMKWTRAKGKELPGLVKRRRSELAMWRDLPEIEGDAPSQTVDEPERRRVRDDPEARAALGIASLGGLGGAATAVRDIADAGDAVSGFGHLLMSPAFLIILATICLAGLIWYWRRQRIDEYGE